MGNWGNGKMVKREMVRWEMAIFNGEMAKWELFVFSAYWRYYHLRSMPGFAGSTLLQ
jgi:hypothetical protein